jgi:hypothetical protein
MKMSFLAMEAPSRCDLRKDRYEGMQWLIIFGVATIAEGV